MAGWADFNAADASASQGRGVFNNRGGSNSSGRWRERGRGRPPPQQSHHQHYRPVVPANANANAHHSSARPPPPQQQPRFSGHAPLDLDRQGQGGSSNSTRRPQPTRTDRPPSTRPTFADHKPPASASASAVVTTANANEPDDKGKRNAANFECNVCFDMAADPVVTKCGHLFCWECIYQWLHVHSHHRECPVCKGQVADDAIIPIYGRGGSAASVNNAPPRPTGARVESARQQLADYSSVLHMDEEEDDPFDLQELRISSLRDAVLSFMPDGMDTEENYDDYNSYTYPDFEEVYDYDLMGFPMFASAAAMAGSSRGHGDIMETFFNNAIGAHHHHHHPEFSYSGANNQNRGGHRQRRRPRAEVTSADDSNVAGVVLGSSLMLGGSGPSYRDNGAGRSNNTGGSSRPNGGWTERRGRSNRNSNSGGGRGAQNSRRQGTHYNN